MPARPVQPDHRCQAVYQDGEGDHAVLEAVLVVLPRLVNRTKIGMDMRAASWNFEATQLMASRSTTSSALHPTVLYSFLPA